MNTSKLPAARSETETTLQGWIRRHPVTSFILLTLGLSYATWSLLFLVIEPGRIMDGPPSAFALMFLGAAMPSLVSLLLTWWLYGPEGLRAFGARLRHWRVGRWWLALLILPLLTAAMPLLRWLAGHPVDAGAMAGLLIPGLALGLAAGLSEEFGWRGFLLPHLLKRYSPLAAAILVGLIWGGLWHGYADYFGLGDRGLAFWPLVLLLGPGVLTARSLIQTRVYQGTDGSLLLAILLHFSGSSTALIFGQTYATVREEVIWTTISTGVILLGAILVWIWLAPRQPQT